jgi:hypothetical protein
MESGDHALAIEAYRTALAGEATGDLRRELEYQLGLASRAAGELPAETNPADPVAGTPASVRRGR